MPYIRSRVFPLLVTRPRTLAERARVIAAHRDFLMELVERKELGQKTLGSTMHRDSRGSYSTALTEGFVLKRCYMAAAQHSDLSRIVFI